MPIVTYRGIAPIMGKMRAGMAKGVTQAAEDLVGKAQAAAPVETGTLRASIHVEGVEQSATEVKAKVATGGESSEYALYQHEGTSRGVPATKFLERPLIENRETYLKFIADAAKI
jgi:HK97 gp10 family phage protein